jgi:hypothetical protein
MVARDDGVDVVLDKGPADPADQNESELAALYFLVLRNQRHQSVCIGLGTRHVLDLGREPDRCKMTRHARRNVG